MSQAQQEIQGIVDKFLFQSADSGYCVFVLQLSPNDTTVVTGHIPSINPGEQVILRGSWIMHTKFGRQFQATECKKQLPSSILGLKKYLGSGLIKGIGKVYAQKMVDHFGVAILDIIDKTPERLAEIEGIGPKRIEQITTAWHDQKEISTIMVFLQDKGISPVFATKIYKQYRQESIALLQENPYRLAEDIWGIGFKSADKVAQNLGFQKDSIKRIKAGIIHTISQATNSGHLYVELEELKKQTIEILELSDTDIEATLKVGLHELYNSEKIKLISHHNHHFISLAQYYYSEKGLANKLLALMAQPSKHTFDLDQIYQTLRADSTEAISLNEDQQHAIMTCLQHKVSVITGGPGTGKTTLIKKLLHILDQQNVMYRLAAPTGRAAKRMMEGTRRHASTLHRLLEFDPSSMSFVHNEQNALKLDFLIVDEASMIDTFLAHALVKALPLQSHLIFIGDVDQLPSVGAGNVLKDMIESKKIASIRLKHIFRQAQDSLIIINAHKINRGEFPVSQLPDTKRDFIFIKEEKPENVFDHLKKMYTYQHPRCRLESSDSMVLVPMNRGIVGTIKLNQDLQQIINPHATDKQIMFGSTLYKINDKVMQIRNNYDKAVFNGDIGTIQDIDVEGKTVHVLFDNHPVEYGFDELNELVLAYAISIHKSQGSEYDIAIIPVFMQHFMLLQRNLIYTAITRAKKLCVFIGQPKALAMAVKNNKTIVRKTFLQEFLTTDLTCR
jgi:exodeoxyribonuclease V alpha subunit